jgi:hypothetical protein
MFFMRFSVARILSFPPGFIAQWAKQPGGTDLVECFMPRPVAKEQR